MRLSLMLSWAACGLFLVAAIAVAQDKPREEQPRPNPGPVRDGERAPPPRREGDAPQPPREGNPPRREGEEPRFPPRRDGERPFGPPLGEDGRPMPRRPDGPPMGEGFHEDPEMQELMHKDHELERQSFELSNRLREARRANRDELRAALQKSVEEHFQTRQARRELQIKRLNEELTRLKEQVEARNAAKDEIVRRRVQELAGDEGAIGF